MRLSEQGRALIKGFEGLSLKAYPDTKKGYSIGYGHFGASPGDVITLAEANRLFDQDAVKYEAAVSYTTPTARQHEFDAMTSLAYNIGTGDVQGGKGGFAGSTVARLHNLGDRQGAADAFLMWKKSDGKDNPVLLRRREKERDIYLNGYSGSSTFETPPEPAPIATTPSKGWPSDPATRTPQPTPSLPYPVAVLPTKTLAAGGIASFITLGLGWLAWKLLHR